MDRDIQTVVKPSITEGNDKVIQFLDGIHGGDGWSSRALEYVEHDDATIVFPAADERSFWVDWDSPAPPNGELMLYETFLTQELPEYLEANFGVPGGGKHRTGVVGMSMGSYSAMNIASKHPEMYRSVLALSGFYNNQSLSGRAAIEMSADSHSAQGNNGIPWDSESSRSEDNPWLNVDKLDMPVYVATSTGIPDPTDFELYDSQTLFDGGTLEAGTLAIAVSWDVWTRLHNKPNVHVTYVPTGIHGWNTWIRAAFTEQKLYWQFNQF